MFENTVKPPKLATLGEWKIVRFAENGRFGEINLHWFCQLGNEKVPCLQWVAGLWVDSLRCFTVNHHKPFLLVYG